MRHSLPAAAAAALLALTAGAAYCKAPKASDNPTLEELYAQARQAEADRVEAAKAQQRDPDREAIERYRDRVAPLTEYQHLVRILTDAKTDRVQPYRPLAAEALVARFGKELEGDPEVRAVRRAIGIELVDLIKAPKSDEKGLQAAGQIFVAWWRPKMWEFGFKTDASQAERTKVRNKMKKFLERGERD